MGLFLLPIIRQPVIIDRRRDESPSPSVPNLPYSPFLHSSSKGKEPLRGDNAEFKKNVVLYTIYVDYVIDFLTILKKVNPGFSFKNTSMYDYSASDLTYSIY